MNEYINKDDVVRIITKLNQEPQYQHTDEDFFCGVATVFDGISDLPTIDAVPVVRCNDCRSAHKGGSGYIWCKGVPHPLDWFCADGKPKDVEESYTCGATGLPCIKCNPGGCNSRRQDGGE